jgi:hypothetical protein
MDEFRDTKLGEQLEILAEPDHGPDYWDRMRLQVAEAAAERRQRPGFARRLRAAFGRRRLRVAIAAATLVAAAAAAAVLIGLPRTPGPEAVNAATVLKRALSAVSSGRTWRADVTIEATDSNESGIDYHYDVTHYHFVQSAGGSYLLTQLGPTRRLGSAAVASRRVTDAVAYDATTGVLRHLRPGRGLTVVRDAALGPPDSWPSPLTGVDFGAALRALQAAGALKLEKTEVDGRQAWTVTCTKGTPVVFPSGSGQGIDWPVYKITVDARTWLPIRFQQVDAGALTAELRIRDVHVNEQLPAGTFALRPPRGLRISHADGGFRRVTLGSARAFAAATPLVPGSVPSGYKLTGVALAARALTANHLVRGKHVFVLQYSHGFDALTVSTRQIADPYYSATDDPVDSYDPNWSVLVRTEAPITSGAFKGVTASVVVATISSTPHLWAVKDGVLLTIAGGASARELLEIANSLQSYPVPSPQD